ncbi:MAG TPA: hypothetical protein VGL89_10880 [Candidatus Koribacter sp.]
MSSIAQARVAAGRGIVRSVYALSRYVRLFGLGHSRTGAQMQSAFARVQGFIPAAGLTISLAGDRLTIDSLPLDGTIAEQSFALFLRHSQRNAISFGEQFTRETLEDIVSAIAFERLAPETPEKELAPVESQDARVWLTDATKLLYFVNVGLHGVGVADDPARDQGEHARLAEQATEDVGRVLLVLGKVGSSESEGAALGAVRELQRIPHPLLNLLREVLMELPGEHSLLAGDALILRAGEQVVIRYILTKLENGDIFAADIPPLLERLGRQLQTLHSVLPSYDDKKTPNPGLDETVEALEHEMWSTAPDAAKRMVLLFDTPFYVPAPCIVAYLERLISHGEELVAATVLKNYGAAVDGRDGEGRRRSARGISDLAELFALVVPDYVPNLVKSVSRQLMRESDLRMQSWLSAALVRLSYTVQQQRDYVATAATVDAMDEIQHRRPALGMELRPRISVENRLPEYVDEALSATQVAPDLVNLLQRHAAVVTQQLCVRSLNCSLREESERLTSLAGNLGDEARDELLRRLKTGNSEEALGAVGLLSSLAPGEMLTLLPKRTSEWDRSQQDTLVRQLAIATSPVRGSVLLKILPELDPLIVPEAIDEIGLSGAQDTTDDLMQIAMSEESQRFNAYSKVKAIEALGRLQAAKALDALKELLHQRKLLQWTQPHELRIAALQAMHMIDPDQATRLIAASGLSERELSIGPLAVDPNNRWARQRRYTRVFPVKPVTAMATSRAGKAGLDIVALSLGGGRALRQGKLQAGTEVTLQLQVALRKLNSQVLVREVVGNEFTFEIADIALGDRSKLRQILLAQPQGPGSQPTGPRAAA